MYENQAVACRILRLTYSSLKRKTGTGEALRGFIWSFVDSAETTVVADTVDDMAPLVQVHIAKPEDEFLVARDIATGDETLYKTIKEAAGGLGVSEIDIVAVASGPYRVADKVLRWADADQRWQPTPKFRFRDTKREAKVDPSMYIASLDKDGTATAVFESATAAAEFTGRSRNTINDLVRAGKTWRRAIAGDYGSFVPC